MGYAARDILYLHLDWTRTASLRQTSFLPSSFARRCCLAFTSFPARCSVQVPKCLGMIGAEWAPDCFRVSFKLETDLDRLLPKARVALER